MEDINEKIEKIMGGIQYEAYSKNLIKQHDKMNYDERTFLINVKILLEKELKDLVKLE